MDLDNKVVIITGGSKGIGRALAVRFAKEGARIAISARGKESLTQAENEIKSFGNDTFAFSGDMRKEKDIKLFVNGTLKNLGQIDILINNAGYGKFANIAEMSTSDWDDMFNLNVRGLFIATRECLPHLRKQKESAVINIASLAGKNTFAGGGAYTATKHAVLAFSRCLMLEERQNGVRVLAICPGSVATNFGHKDIEKEKRILQAEDVAESVLHMLKLPQRAMVSEIDIRPTNP